MLGFRNAGVVVSRSRCSPPSFPVCRPNPGFANSPLSPLPSPLSLPSPTTSTTTHTHTHIDTHTHTEGLCCGCKCCFGLDLKDHQAEYPLRAKAAACACIGIFILLSVGMIAAGQFKGNLGMTQGMYRVVGAGMTPTADLVQGGVKPVSGMLGGLIGKDLLSFMENLNATVYPNFRTKVINENLDCILSSVNELPDPAELKTTVRD